MAVREGGILVDFFDLDEDPRIRVRCDEIEEAYVAGDIVSVTDGELAGFARVVSVDADAITLDVLAVTPADQVDELQELLAGE